MTKMWKEKERKRERSEKQRDRKGKLGGMNSVSVYRTYYLNLRCPRSLIPPLEITEPEQGRVRRELLSLGYAVKI